MAKLHIKLNGITKCSNMVANILTATPPPPPQLRSCGWGQQVKSQLFQNMVMLHNNEIKGTHEMQQHGSKYFACRPPLPYPRGCGPKVKNSFFSEYGLVGYQIKGNHKCRILVANILPVDPPPLFKFSVYFS